MGENNYYIPHAALILTNTTEIEQFEARKVLKAYDSYKKNGKRLINPWEIEIHLTGSCPFACKECSYATRHTGEELSVKDLNNIFSLISDKNTHCIFFSGGGDPFAWGHWKELLKLRQRFAPQVPIGVSTNLLGLPKNINLEEIDFYQIHVSGFNKESYTNQIGLDVFDKFCKNLERVVLSDAKVTLKFILNDYVCKHLKEFLDFIIQFRAESIIFKLEQNFLKNEECSLVNYDKVKEVYLNHPIKKKYELCINNVTDPLFYNDVEVKECHIVESGLYCLIRENGEVFPCIASTNREDNSIGNIKQMSFDSVMSRVDNLKRFSGNMKEGICPLKACRHYRLNKVIQELYDDNLNYDNIHDPIML